MEIVVRAAVITQQDYSVTAGILAVSTFALLTVAFGWANWRFPKTRPLLLGTDGKVSFFTKDDQG